MFKNWLENEPKVTLVCAVCSAVSLILSITGALRNILPVDIAWIAIVLCGVPILVGAAKGVILEHDIKADLLVSLALIASVATKEFFAAGEVALIMQIGSLLEDYTSGRTYADSVCYAFYPIDLHDKVSGIRPAHLKEGMVATVPLRALVVKGVDGVLVAGRCVSSDRLANSALRVEATCMATGQAAGAAAALAARHGTTALKLDFGELAALLRAHRAIVPAE